MGYRDLDPVSASCPQWHRQAFEDVLAILSAQQARRIKIHGDGADELGNNEASIHSQGRRKQHVGRQRLKATFTLDLPKPSEKRLHGLAWTDWELTYDSRLLGNQDPEL
ncbi:hypothetical protein EG328_007833 [Venturia inaequalis]|uniref:Uncharacterized protein n=1 Tax=Venturia inaequalis TaxID=5025 RepID=A0A8H3YP04_VENIN|nr:hypothetical protein EG328_007833 [Venturia inaequalis]